MQIEHSTNNSFLDSSFLDSSFYVHAKEKIQHRVNKLQGLILDSVNHIIDFAKDIFLSLKSPKTLSKEEIISKVKEFTVSALKFIPEKIYECAKVIVEFAKALFTTIRTHSNYIAVAMPGLQIVTGLGKLIEIPVVIGSIINILAPLKNAIWIPALGTVASILSVSKIFYTGFLQREANKFNQELKAAANHAFLNRLKEIPNNEALRHALKIADKTLAKKIDNQLASLTGDQKSIESLIEEIKKSGIDQQVLNELQVAADLAYIDCIQKKDEDFLLKHFDVKGDAIKAALERINNHPTAEIHRVRETLEGRLKDRRASNILSIVMDTVSTIASTLLAVAGFMLTGSPLLPIGITLLIGVGILCVLKLIIEYKKKEKFENELNINN